MYYSLKNNLESNFKEAVKKGIASDGSLFFPKKITKIKKNTLEKIKYLSNIEIGLLVIKNFVGNQINEKDLIKILEKSISIKFNLVKVGEFYSFELFHGPTLAFKDVGANFLANCLNYFNSDNSKKSTIIVATSGDTGAAVAKSFFGMEKFNIIILYPKNKISKFQEKQITTLGGNIYPIEIDGSFDDCQSLAKNIIIDQDISRKLDVSSANSINIGRWLPQVIYYFILYREILRQDIEKNLVISVPSGNFGNICAGLVAYKMGLPVEKYIAATNENDTISRYLNEGIYKPKKTKKTISNAMDVNNPNNFPRIMKLFGNNLQNLKTKFKSYSFNDYETRKEILLNYKSFNYLLDPHGTVGLLGLKKFFNIEKKTCCGVFLETAHPIKFSEIIESIIKNNPFDKSKINSKKPLNKICLSNDLNILKKIILEI